MKAKITGFVRVAAALALAALAGCGTPSAQPSAQMRVGTFNIRSVKDRDRGARAWADRRDDFAAFVAGLDCDVVGMQEVLPEQMAFLRERFPGYGFVGDYRCDRPGYDEASPVCYRRDRFDVEKSGTFWLSERPDERGSVGWDAKYPRVCSYAVLRDRRTGRRFCFANCHTDHKGEKAREKGMLLVVERMKEFGAGAPIVFVGDHNCRENEPPAQAVAKVLDNALYVSETPPKGPWRTFNGWEWRDEELSCESAMKLPVGARNAESGSPDGRGTKNGRYRHEECGARIDFIYVSDDVRVKGVETVVCARPGGKNYSSDHFAVVADVVPGCVRGAAK